jgi:hypothetical protein
MARTDGYGVELVVRVIGGNRPISDIAWKLKTDGTEIVDLRCTLEMDVGLTL